MNYQYHGGNSIKKRIFVNSELKNISNGILITTRQLGFHLNDSKFDLIFTLNENELKFKNTKKIINFIPKSVEEREEEGEEEVNDIILSKKNLKSFKYSYRKYLQFLNNQQTESGEEGKYFKLNIE